ncbi:MAG: hypothetical protein KatS3mg093_020 [Candidatus Parcubacteria bacterium]|nr:MAG: hypothetical protein KatS3mg093_020 [Candidatus Parcubacteria bacterium]
MKEVISQILNLLSEGNLEESQNLLLKNITIFPREVQVEILASIIEGKMLEQIEILERIKSSLEKNEHQN